MSSQAPKTRTIDDEIEIAAPIEAVWKALTDAEELTRWLSEEARVTPGAGGTMWLSWGEGQAGESRIETWEPNRRLLIRNLPWDSGEACGGEYDEKAAAMTPMMQEFVLETREGRTVLRLVDSGIPDSPEWEGMYDSKTRGWHMFFLALRHYLEKHNGKPRKQIIEMRPIQGALAEAWGKLTGAEGLAASGSLAEAPEGTRYSVTASTGDRLEGEVLINIPPKTISLTVENMDDALLSGSFEEMGDTTYLYFTLSTYGTSPDSAEELRRRWSGLLERLFPAA